MFPEMLERIKMMKSLGGRPMGQGIGQPPTIQGQMPGQMPPGPLGPAPMQMPGQMNSSSSPMAQRPPIMRNSLGGLRSPNRFQAGGY